MITQNSMLARWIAALLTVWFVAPAGLVAQNPGWTVDPAAFQHSMNVTSALSVDGAAVAASDYTLAAFVGEAVRGVAQPTDVGGKPVFFLTVYANADGEVVTFKLYDAIGDTVRVGVQSLLFSINDVLGTPSQPFQIDFGESEVSDDPEDWTVDPSGFGFSMTATVQVGIGDGAALTDANAVMAAFVGSDVRGRVASATVAGPRGVPRSLFFLTVYANSDGEEIDLRISSPGEDSVYVYPAAFTFASNTVLGSAGEPSTVGSEVTVATDELGEDVGAGASAEDNPFALEVFPVPAVDEVSARWDVPVGMRVRARVYDVRGRLVDDLGEAGGGVGVRSVGRYPAGVYYLVLQGDEQIASRAFVVAG